MDILLQSVFNMPLWLWLVGFTSAVFLLKFAAQREADSASPQP